MLWWWLHACIVYTACQDTTLSCLSKLTPSTWSSHSILACVCVCAHDQTCISYVSADGFFTQPLSTSNEVMLSAQRNVKYIGWLEVKWKWTSSQKGGLSKQSECIQGSLICLWINAHKDITQDWILNNKRRGTLVSDQDISRSLQF